MADHPEQSERRKVIRIYVQSIKELQIEPADKQPLAAAEGRAGAGGASSGAAAAAVDAPLLGQRVVLGGLSARPELNGQRGEARSFEGGRYAVALEGGESVRVRPDNLSPAVARAMVDVLVHICHGSARALGRWLCDSKCAQNRSSITTELEELARARLRELVRSAQSADDLEQLRASLDAVRFAGMDESGLEEARCRLERDDAVARLYAACQGSEWSELWVAMRQAEKLGLDCEAVEAAKRRMDELVQPEATEGGLSDAARAVAQRMRADADAAVTEEELASFLADRWFSKYTGYLPNFTLTTEDKLLQVKACCGPDPPWTDRAGWRAASERMLLYLIRTQMTELKSLDADGSALPIKQLTGADPIAAIDLSQQRLGELSATIIGNLVQGNTALETLNLEGIELNVSQLRGSVPVETVDLSKRRLGVYSTIVIGHLLAVNTRLITLNLFDNGISDQGAKAIADALTKNSSLTELNLGNQAVRGARENVDFRSRPKIGNDGAEAIADALKTNATLVRLYLNNNSIRDDGAYALANALSVNANHKLVTLNLSGNEEVCGQATAAVRTQLRGLS